MYYAAICAIARDELDDIHEWLLYHLAIGFEHVLIYDNNSKIPLKRELAPFIAANLVTVIDCPLTDAQQLSAYMDAIHNWGANAYWLAFIDIDEFILPLEHEDIRDFLDDYREFGGVCANWCVFSSNGHIKRPGGGILENYTRSLGLDGHIKSIVRPALAHRAVSAHNFTFKAGYYCVNEDKIPVRGFHTYPLAGRIRINHYYYKSQQDFYAKIARGFVTRMKTDTERRIGTFYDHLREPDFHDDKILRFKPKMDKFARFPPPVVADILHDGMGRDLLAGIGEIDQCIGQNRLSRAAGLWRTLSRYCQSSELNILGANIAFLQGRFDSGLDLLRREMSRADDATLRLCYQSLGNYYALSGRAEVKGSIGEYLR